MSKNFKLNNLIKLIFDHVSKYDKEKDFQKASDELEDIIFNLSLDDFVPLITKIGIIPEQIEHDSKEEKLFTKVAEIFLARCFQEIGLKSSTYITRGNTADVIAKSKFYNYTLVADAKSFRLSRTAKNQKDFKVESLSVWKKDHDFAVLCSPYFQYPKKKSAIYKQALDYNVLLFSWEYFSFLIENDVKEDLDNNLSKIWNFSSKYAKKTKLIESDKNFFEQQNEFLIKKLNLSTKELNKSFEKFKEKTIKRGNKEIEYWKYRIDEIKNYSKEEAIEELIKSLKVEEKIKTIKKYINDLEK